MKPSNSKILLGRNMIFFSLFLVIILSVTSLLYYQSERTRILNSKYNELAFINRLKEKHIQAWKNYQLSNAKTLSYSPIFAGNVDRYIRSKTSSLKNILTERCNVIRNFHSCQNVMVADTNGAVEISLDPDLKSFDTITLSQIHTIIRRRNALIGNMVIDPSDKSIYIDILSPVVNPENKTVAVLILRLNPVTDIIPEFKNDQSDYNHAGTFLVFKQAGHFTVLNGAPVRSDSVIELPVNRFSETYTKPQRYNGTGIGKKNVIAHIQPVSGTSWFLFTQEGYQELFTEFHRYAIIDSIITATLIILLILTVVLVDQFRQNTVYRNLLQTELIYKKEEHQRFRTTLYSIGDGVITTDALGFIMHMNSVATKLTGWKEEEANGKSAGEVFSSINEKTREAMECPVDKVLRDGLIVGLADQTLLFSKNGMEYPVTVSAVPIRNNEERIIGAVLVFSDQTEKKHAEKVLRESEQRILSSVIETEEKERLTFSQELHDGLGPLISAARMYLQLLSVPDIKVNIKNTIRNAEVLIDEAIRSIREISFKLSPHILQNYGLEDALRNYIEKIKASKKIQIHLTYICVSRLSQLGETIVYRVLCECINNTLKHAKAKNITISIRCINNVMEIYYIDDGCGFDVEKTFNDHKGIGLMNMQSRIKSINGSMQISSAPGFGTNINIKMRVIST